MILPRYCGVDTFRVGCLDTFLFPRMKNIRGVLFLVLANGNRRVHSASSTRGTYQLAARSLSSLKIFPRYRVPYLSAAITSELVRRAIGELDASTATRRRCILMGHSMGCITAATAALDPSLSPQHTTLVLVAPALSLGSSSKKLTAEQQRAAARRKAGAAAVRVPVEGGGAQQEAPRASSEDGILRGGGRRGAGSSESRRRGVGPSGVVGAVVGAPVRAASTVLHVGFWLFNRCLLPMIYPLEILGLRCEGSYETCLFAGKI